MSEKKITRLRELADVVTKGKESWHEFSMRIPADPDRDADLILTWAADEIGQLQDAAYALLRHIQDQLEQEPGWMQYEFYSPEIDLYVFNQLGKALHSDDPAIQHQLMNRYCGLKPETTKGSGK